MDPRDRFTGAADKYAQHRPSYPPELLDWIAATTGVAPPARVVDLGCGTGISARLLAARGYAVIGVDPNEEMLTAARAAAGGPSYRRGEAAATGLPDASVDLCTAAQAFHWFELAPTLRELRRILVPGGACVAFWNTRGSTPFLDAYDALLVRRSPDYAGMARAQRTIEVIRAAVGQVSEAHLSSQRTVDEDTMVGFAFSTSYVLHGVADKPAFEHELRSLFRAHADGAGQVTLELVVLAAAWSSWR